MLDWGAAVPYTVTAAAALALVAFLSRGDVRHATRVLRRRRYGVPLAALALFFLPVPYEGSGRIAEDPSGGCFTTGWSGRAPLPFAVVEEIRNHPHPGPPLTYGSMYGAICY